MTDSENSEPLIKRWSRRKSESATKTSTMEPAKQSTVVAYAEEPLDSEVDALNDINELKQAPLPVRNETNEEIPEASPEDLEAMSKEHDLPLVDSLDAKSDFTPFMQVGIPDALKQAALRRLWRIDPTFGFLDGMNDYDEDYNIIDKLITLLDTSYKVGKGHLSDDDDDEEEMKDEELNTEESVTETASLDPESETESHDDPDSEDNMDDLDDLDDENKEESPLKPEKIDSNE